VVIQQGNSQKTFLLYHLFLLMCAIKKDGSAVSHPGVLLHIDIISGLCLHIIACNLILVFLKTWWCFYFSTIDFCGL
jgi:hypothetical protein